MGTQNIERPVLNSVQNLGWSSHRFNFPLGQIKVYCYCHLPLLPPLLPLLPQEEEEEPLPEIATCQSSRDLAYTTACHVDRSILPSTSVTDRSTRRLTVNIKSYYYNLVDLSRVTKSLNDLHTMKEFRKKYSCNASKYSCNAFKAEVVWYLCHGNPVSPLHCVAVYL